MVKKEHAQVVIIGGGMLGVGLLYHLAEEGWTDSLLLEKGELTSGSTWHAAGQCPSFVADYNMAKIHHYGNTLYPRLEDLTDQYVGWHGCGGIRFALNEVELDWFRHVEGVSRSIGFEMHIISPKEIKEYNPYVDVSGVVAGALTIGDGHVDPAGCCNALAKGAQKMGASILRKTRVLDIQKQRNGEWQVVTTTGKILCEHVVNAAGCYARQISHMVGTDVPITNMEHHYLVTDEIDEFAKSAYEIPVMRDPYPSAYYRQEQKSALIGIYETHEGKEAWSHRDGWPEWSSENELFAPDLDRISPYLEKVMQRMPIWEKAGIKRIVHGAIPHTPDANPLLGPAQGIQNFWQCCGSAVGIAQGAGCGKYLAQWMVHGDAEINMGGLDPRRYCGITDKKWVSEKSFQDYTHMYQLHLPGEERPAGRGRRVSALYDKLKSKGAVYSESAAWERPKWISLDGRDEEPSFYHNNIFDVISEECRAVREGVGVFDLSNLSKFSIIGADAYSFLNRITANQMPKKDGGIVLTHLLGDNGMLNAEFTISRLDEKHFYLLSAGTAQHRDLDYISMAVLDTENVTVTDLTSENGALLLAGPNARDVLSKITNSDITNESFQWLHCKKIDISGISLWALRINYIGELGWELHCPMERLLDVYNIVWEAGRAYSIADFGLYAVNSLRLEKAYKGWGAELTNEVTMIEAGLDRFISWDKGNFIGRDELLKRVNNGVLTKIVYCELEPGNSDIFGGEPIISGSRTIGVSTSGGYGYYTQKNLFFAYVEPAFTDPGLEIEVYILGKYRKATVLAESVWDPSNSRLRC